MNTDVTSVTARNRAETDVAQTGTDHFVLISQSLFFKFEVSFEIPFEEIEEYLRKNRNCVKWTDVDRIADVFFYRSYNLNIFTITGICTEAICNPSANFKFQIFVTKFHRCEHVVESLYFVHMLQMPCATDFYRSVANSRDVTKTDVC